MQETQGSISISTKLERIANLAQARPDEALTTLAHHIDLAWLREAYRRTRKDGAVGVDGVTAVDYEQDLEANLQGLLERFKSEHYRAPPVRRVHIPKGRGTTRPIGIPTLEDKVLQRAVAMVLEAVYEQDFSSSSYGFRPGRSAHQALAHAQQQLTYMAGGWVIEIDIEEFFESIDHRMMRAILRRRVRDGVLLRAIDKWLKAGVMGRGGLRRSSAGTPQGGVISPLLANIFLNEAFDVWFERDVRPRIRGRAFAVRYADDAMIGFAREEQARRVLKVLHHRFRRYGLRLHPSKTRLVEFCRPDLRSRRVGPRATRQPATFDLLGFTHVWARSRKGKWIVRRLTAGKSFSRALGRVREWCRDNRHRPVRWQYVRLSRALKGHYAYFGVTGNRRGISRFRHEVIRAWRKWLNRRSHKGNMPWWRMKLLMQRYPLPNPRIVHRFGNA